MPVNVAVVGAAGAVGRKVVEILEERDFPVGRLLLMATARSAGSTIRFRGRDYTVQPVAPDLFEGVHIAFFAVPSQVSRELAPEAVKRGAVVIDKSNAFRSDPSVPLVVPEVNADALTGHQGIVSSPNCSTIQLVLVLKPLDDLATVKRVVVSTYQAVSGTGREAVEELFTQMEHALAGRPLTPEVYPHPIALNVLPHIDDFDPNGYSREEMKLVNETRKIMDRPDLAVSATTVRVPVEVGHSEAVWIETERRIPPADARAALERAPGVVVEDDPGRGVYPLPVRAAGRDEVFVGRIREDISHERGLALWIVADNLRKGAATNAVQIAEALMERGLTG
ncbi:MAG TPA: aspartate-semialdehyde dehydrogenase [Clostridiales bacterium]|nr:aspartate-semialdehyde dehydrogenase [Clostridiales bacterium]